MLNVALAPAAMTPAERYSEFSRDEQHTSGRRNGTSEGRNQGRKRNNKDTVQITEGKFFRFGRRDTLERFFARLNSCLEFPLFKKAF